jgi:hypothetical protein
LSVSTTEGTSHGPHLRHTHTWLNGERSQPKGVADSFSFLLLGSHILPLECSIRSSRIDIVIFTALSKLSQHNMHGQGPLEKRRLLSCPIPYQLRGHSHIYTAPGTAMGSVWVPSTVTRMCRMAPNVFTQPIYKTSTENMCSIQNHRPSG